MNGSAKTPLMRYVERMERQPLERLLPNTINDLGGPVAAADRLNIARTTLFHWMDQLGVRYEQVVLMPGDTLEIKPAPSEVSWN